MKVWTRLTTNLAIDLGTANTCVYEPGRGIVVHEPSIVAFNTSDSSIVAVGEEAQQMLGRTPPALTALRPLKAGVIANFDAAEKMLGYFIRKARGGRRMSRLRLVIGVPTELTPVERRAVTDAAARAGSHETHLIEEPVAAAIGADLPIAEPVGNMIVDIGGGTTDIAVLSLGGVAARNSIRVAGNAMDEAIISAVRKRYDLLIGERMAERLKIQLGSAVAVAEPVTMEAKGRHLFRGLPETVSVTDAEIRDAIERGIQRISQAVRDTLERTPPELSADIFEHGISLTGGGSLLRQLDRRLASDTGVPVKRTKEPLSTVVLGAGQLLTNIDLLRRIDADAVAA
jgi:rod shape-determining protein MreB